MQMNHRCIFIQWVCGLLSIASVTNVCGSCIPIERVREGDYPGARTFDAFKISKPGQYCLNQDITSKRFIVLSEGGERSVDGPIGFVSASVVDIDLQGHALIADSLGTWILDAGDVKGRLIESVHLYNGTIKSRASGGVLLNGLFSFQLDKMMLEYFSGSPKFNNHSSFEKAIFKELPWIKPPAERAQFPVTGHRIENLNIEVGGRVGIELKGASNAVRNNIITLNGVSGVVLWGGGQIVENNTIIFKSALAAQGDAPIKIYLADNSIIRNNTIVIEGWKGKPEAAIRIVDSRNVFIENNKIFGVRSLYRIEDEESNQKSSVKEFGNTFEGSSLMQKLFGY